MEHVGFVNHNNIEKPMHMSYNKMKKIEISLAGMCFIAMMVPIISS